MDLLQRASQALKSRPSHFAGIALALFLGFALAGCSGEGTSTNCSLDSCTVTFDRGVKAEAEILGVEARLVSVKGEDVTIEVAGTEVTVPAAGAPVDVEGFQVTVEEITETQVTVKISAATQS